MSSAPSQDLTAERQALGGWIVSGVEIPDDLKAKDFFRDRHQRIFRAITALAERDVRGDVDALSAELMKLGDFSDEDQRYLHELASGVNAPGNAAHHGEAVRKHSLIRQRVDLARKLASPDLNGDAPELLDRMRELIEDVGDRIEVRPADLSRVRPVRWLWQKRVLIGYLSLLLGAEGIGKGTLTAWLIAAVTRGTLPGDLEGKPSRVLIVGDEDSFDSVVVPRLYAAGADLDLIETLSDEDGDALDVRADAERLTKLIRERGYRLLYIDALLDILGADADDWRSKDVRDRLRPIRHVARDTDVAALASLHPNKGSRGTFRDLVSGSHAFNASSRSSLLLAPHPEDEDRRVLVRGKGNLSAAPAAFEFEIQGRELEINGHGFSLPVVADTQETALGVEDVVKPQREAPVRESLADEIDAVGTGEIQGRADIARALGREPSDGSVGRALNQLEDQGRWEKVDRGKWRRIAIATSKEVAIGKTAEGEVS